jgi:hypothetical protein
MDWLDSVFGWVFNMGSAMDGGDMMGAGSAVIALVSFLFTWRMAHRQDKRAAASLKLAHDNDIIRWSDEAIIVLADAHEMLCEKGVGYPDGEFRQKRSACRARISAIIDRGRLFFPNVDLGDDHGVDKEAGYKGHRQPALEALVSAYRLLGEAGAEAGPDHQASEGLMAIRRGFVAEVFKAVEPERRGMTLKELSA